MDNRKDSIEDQQSTPEHPAGQKGRPLDPQTVQQPGQAGSGLGAGPHNDSPPSNGIEDTYQQPKRRDGSRGASNEQAVERTDIDSLSSRMKTFSRTVTGNPLPWFISGAALVLLALQRARHR